MKRAHTAGTGTVIVSVGMMSRSIGEVMFKRDDKPYYLIAGKAERGGKLERDFKRVMREKGYTVSATVRYLVELGIEAHDKEEE